MTLNDSRLANEARRLSFMKRFYVLSLSVISPSGPMLKSKSTMLRLGMKPCLCANTW